MGGRIKGKRDKDREKDKRKRGKNSDGLKDGDTGSMTESHREAKGTESRTALEEKNNCDGQWERDVEKGKILRKRERIRLNSPGNCPVVMNQIALRTY